MAQVQARSTSAAHEAAAVDTKCAKNEGAYQGVRHFQPKRPKAKNKADYYRHTTVKETTDDSFTHKGSQYVSTSQPLQDQPSNVYLNLEYNYLSTNSLFTIRHPWKNGKLPSAFTAREKGHTGSSSLQQDSAGVEDDMLRSWWASAKKWGLLTGTLADLQLREAGQTTPPSTATATAAATYPSLDSVSIPDSDKTAQTAEKPSWPFLKMNKALTLRIEQLQSELGIDTATLQKEVELLAQCNPSEEAIHQFGVKLLKIQSEGNGPRGRNMGGKGFASSRHEKSRGVRTTAWQRKKQPLREEGGVDADAAAPGEAPAGRLPLHGPYAGIVM
jgi:hypothetical protein